MNSLCAKMRSQGRIWLGLAVWLPAMAAAAANPVAFNRDIRPILADHCFRCHGPDKGNRKAKLRLDLREAALDKEAFVPGKPDESELIRRINTPNLDDLMPPEEIHKPLSPAQKDLLKRWISEGAEYQPHWAYIPPARPAVPVVSGRRSAEGSPIDAFILAELAKHQIKPSPAADRRTLLRRLSLDLTGLPPTPEETGKFLRDQSPKAYEKQVDRLLASPHYGERMAVPWLDLARYADTVGYHGDQNQNVFPYRDYVINAFNANKPFDRFTIEQLAGDLLPNATIEQKTATGFNRLNMMTREGGAQPKEYLAKYAADRVRTVSATWLGSTMGCCECHDHKYDPFSTKDFYAMEAFFADIRQWGVYTDYGYTPNPDLKGWSNDHPFPPEIEVDSPYLQRRIARLHEQARALAETSAKKLAADANQRAAFENWRTASLAFLQQEPTGWVTPPPEVFFKLKDTNAVIATNFTVQADGTVLFDTAAKNDLALTLPLSGERLAAIRLEITPHAEGPANPTHARAGKARKTTKKKMAQASAIVLTATLKSKNGDKKTKLAFYHAEADHKQERYSNGHAIIGVTDRWLVSPEHDLQTGIWLLDQPLQVQAGDTLTVNLGEPVLAAARVSVSPFAAEEPLAAGGGEPLRDALGNSSNRRPDAEPLVNETYLLSTAWDAAAFGNVRKIFNDVRECRGGRSPTLVTEAHEPIVTRVLPRGNWQDESGEIVQPAPPHFLGQPNPDGTNRLTRLDLARWLVARDNPLTARTVMNRQWKELFGRGLSPVIEDLGAQGESPSHPELLDWLAVEFMDSGWDVKHMVKLMVMSSTYRQSANLRPELAEMDPNNRLLASQNPRRLDAEFVRDNALSIAGLLNPEIGGPSAFPYQPPGYYANLQFPDRDYYPDTNDEQYRRGVYAHWQRTFLQPMLANFDAPAREECTANRNLSNTPQQALTLLNDPTFVECARVFAEKVLSLKATSNPQRLEFAFERALARPVKETEKASLLAFLAEQRAPGKKSGDEPEKIIHVGNAPVPKDVDASELAAWTQVCRVILNLHETITRY